MKQISNEVAVDSDGLEEETTNPGGIRQRVFTLVDTQGFIGGSAMSLTAHCLLVENKNKHMSISWKT